jgi:Tol biopolymer transport system component
MGNIMKRFSPSAPWRTLIGVLLASLACDLPGLAARGGRTVPEEARWGIYSLDPASQEVGLLYSSSEEIVNLDLNAAGDRLAFSRKVGGEDLRNLEIFTVGVDGLDAQRLTSNQYLDTYPAWSPDDSQIAYLSWPGPTLDIYLMQSDGSAPRLLYDSGRDDADIDWVGGRIVFTRDSRIWIMRSDGSDARPLTDPPRAGESGDANLPFGDYDPRLSPDGAQVVFERLVDDASPHGNYDLFTILTDGSGLHRITRTGYSQGLAAWSPAGDQLVYIVTAMDGAGKFDAYAVRPDGGDNRNITPAFFPARFLMHAAVFSQSGSMLYFIGEWWPAGG